MRFGLSITGVGGVGSELALVVRGCTDVFSMIDLIAGCVRIDTTSIGWSGQTPAFNVYPQHDSLGRRPRPVTGQVS